MLSTQLLEGKNIRYVSDYAIDESRSLVNMTVATNSGEISQGAALLAQYLLTIFFQEAIYTEARSPTTIKHWKYIEGKAIPVHLDMKKAKTVTKAKSQSQVLAYLDSLKDAGVIIGCFPSTLRPRLTESGEGISFELVEDSPSNCRLVYIARAIIRFKK